MPTEEGSTAADGAPRSFRSASRFSSPKPRKTKRFCPVSLLPLSPLPSLLLLLWLLLFWSLFPSFLIRAHFCLLYQAGASCRCSGTMLLVLLNACSAGGCVSASSQRPKWPGIWKSACLWAWVGWGLAGEDVTIGSAVLAKGGPQRVPAFLRLPHTTNTRLNKKQTESRTEISLSDRASLCVCPC